MAVPIKGRKQGAQNAQGEARELPSRRLAAIMFTDLVGYSAMAHRDEALAIELLELHRGWVRAILPQFGGHEIETVGDAFLIEFGSALAAVECAVALQQRFADHNDNALPTRRMKLRVGIHLGDVEHAAGKVMGDGVNIASRIHGMAEPGGICVSEDVQRAVRNRGGLVFTTMGSPKLKNIETPLELFEVHAGHRNRQAALLAGARRKLGKVPRWLWILLAIIFLANVFDDDDNPEKGRVKAEVMKGLAAQATPSIAVLPFENLSSDPDSAFFTDGLHDTVIGHLSRVSGIKVISRTSVMNYRGKQNNLRRIGRELGANHVLEGSVQRADGRLRVAAQLIETNTDTHVWSHEYDRELKDVFAVQADIAQSVAQAVHAKLTPQEQASIESVPTQNPKAYDLYLRAVLIERRSEPKGAQISEAIAWLEQAVALDPQFALAYALLARLHDMMYWYGIDPTDARRALIDKNADMALRLDPKLPEAHVAKALFHYHGSRNYEAALGELEVARTLAPGNASVHFWLGPIYRRQGRWDDALESFERATTLDPLNTNYVSEQGGTLQMMRRYAAATSAYARLTTLEPEIPVGKVLVAYNAFLMTGQLAPFEQAVNEVPTGFDPGCQVTGMRVGVLTLKRDFAGAQAVGAACREPFVPASGGTQIPIEYFFAQIKWLQNGRKPTAEAARARDILEKAVADRPDNVEARMHLAHALLLSGDARRAVQEADRALEEMPLSRDAVTGAGLLRRSAEIYANAGQLDRAFEALERGLEVPNGGFLAEVKLDPAFDPLRADKRFAKLEEAEPD
jgi:adenylate cyclase